MTDPAVEELRACALRLERQLDALGWQGEEGDPPTLWKLHREDGGGSLRFDHLPTPIGIWRPGYTPGLDLRRVAEVARGPGRVLAARWLAGEGQLVGLAFAAEGWSATARLETVEDLLRLRRDADTRRLHQRPDRVEVRMVHARLLAGERADVLRMRGEEARVIEEEPLGGVPAGLQALVQALGEVSRGD